MFFRKSSKLYSQLSQESKLSNEEDSSNKRIRGHRRAFNEGKNGVSYEREVFEDWQVARHDICGESADDKAGDKRLQEDKTVICTLRQE